jgi:hypothetical protein
MVGRMDCRIVGLAIVFLLCWIGCIPLAVRGTVVWSDNFNDGNYDGWCVCNNTEAFGGDYGFNGSQWKVANGYLQLDQENLGIITRPSNVAYGTWSFDFKVNDTAVGLGTFAEVVFISNNAVLTSDDYVSDAIASAVRFDVFSHEEPLNFTLTLWKRHHTNLTMLDSYGPVPVAGWHHFDLTRNTTGWISVYYNGSPVPILEGENTDLETNELFWLWFEEWHMIDNIVVDDEVRRNSIDWLAIGIIGASAVVAVAVLVVLLKRR